MPPALEPSLAINRDKVTAQAIKLLQAGKHEKAIGEFKKLVDDDPKDVRTLLKIGDTYVKMGRTSDAIQSYERVASIYSDQGFYLKAVAVYKQMLRVDASLPEVHLKLAEMYQQLNLSSDSLQHYQQVAVFYEQQGRTAETLNILKRMVDLDPDNLPSRIKLAELFAQQQMSAEAIEEFRSAAAYLREQDRLDDYVRVAERLIYFDPTALDVTNELAEVYMHRGEPKLALGKLQICFKADPRNVDTLGRIADAFLKMDQVPKTVSVYKEMARIYGQTGRQQEAMAHWQKVLAVIPNDPEATNAMGLNAPPQTGAPAGQLTPSMVGPSVVSGPPEAAPAPAAAAAAPVAAPARSVAVDEKAEQIGRILTETDVYVKYGLRDKALDHLRRVFELDKDHLEAHVKLHEIHLGLGNQDAAAEQLRVLVGLGEQQSDPRTAEWRAEMNASNQPSGALPPPPAEDNIVELREDDDLIVLEEEAALDIVSDEPASVEEKPALTPAPMEIPDLPPLAPEPSSASLGDMDEGTLAKSAPASISAFDNLDDDDLLEGADLDAAAEAAAAMLGGDDGLDDLNDRLGDEDEAEADAVAAALLAEEEAEGLFGGEANADSISAEEDLPDDAMVGGSAQDAALPDEGSGELILGLNDAGDDFGAQLEAANQQHFDDAAATGFDDAGLDDAGLGLDGLGDAGLGDAGLGDDFEQGFDSQFDQPVEPASQEAVLQPASDAVPLENADLAELEDALSSADADRLVKAALDGIDDAFGDAGFNPMESSAASFGTSSGEASADAPASEISGSTGLSDVDDLPLSQLPSMTADAVLQDSELGADPFAEAPPENPFATPDMGPESAPIGEPMADLDATARMDTPSVVSADSDDPFGQVVPDGFGLQDDEASYASTEIMSLSPDELAEIRAFADAAEAKDGDNGAKGGADLVGAPLVQQPAPPSELESLGLDAPPPPPLASETGNGFEEATVAMQLPVEDFSKARPTNQGLPEPSPLTDDPDSFAAQPPVEDDASLDAVAAAAADEFIAESTSAKTPRLGLSEQAHGFESDPATQFYPDEMEEAEFFIQQELLDEAREILTEIHEELEDSERVKWMLARVDARENGLPEPPAPWEAALEESLAEEIGDLGNLLDDVLPSEQDLQVSVDEVLSQFKKGVAETVDEDDAETHYNLGIAYREMGLAKDAISEFDLAARAPSKAADSLHLIGLCHFDLGDHNAALESFTRALLSDHATEQQRAVNEYQRGVTLMEMGNATEAVTAFESAKEHGAEQRDLDERLAAAHAAAPLTGASPLVGEAPPRRNKNIDYV